MLIVCRKCDTLNRVDPSRAANSIPNCGRCKEPIVLNGLVQNLSIDQLNRVMNEDSERTFVVDFWAPWCAPCRSFAPVFEAASLQHSENISFVKINTEQDPGIAHAMGIRSIPTLIVFKNCAEVHRQSGAMPAPMFEQYLAQFL